MEWIWLFVIIIAVILDFATSDFLFAGFGVGAVLALILSIVGINLIVQLITFGVVGGVFIFAIYPVIKKKIKKDNLGTAVMEDTYIGKIITLDNRLEANAETLIKFEGIYWTFKNTDDNFLEKGEKAKIAGLAGNKLLLEKIK
ncbi:MAG: NfeD family protein [Sarcina sp.]